MASSLPTWDGAAEQLAQILAEDANSVVRHEAAFLLGELRGAGRISESMGIKELCEAALHDRSIVVRHESTEALYSYPGSIADEALRQLLSDASEEIRETAAISLTWKRDRERTS